MLHNNVSLITMGQYLVQRSSLERPVNADLHISINGLLVEQKHRILNKH